eukprot:scaffold70598_cov30-Tisochrysis_lutea.AAC.2
MPSTLGTLIALLAELCLCNALTLAAKCAFNVHGETRDNARCMRHAWYSRSNELPQAITVECTKSNYIS